MNTEPRITPAERASLEAQLRARQRELRGEVSAQLKNQDDPRLVGLRNRMEDTDDWAAADAMASHELSSAICATVEAISR